MRRQFLTIRQIAHNIEQPVAHSPGEVGHVLLLAHLRVRQRERSASDAFKRVRNIKAAKAACVNVKTAPYRFAGGLIRKSGFLIAAQLEIALTAARRLTETEMLFNSCISRSGWR